MKEKILIQILGGELVFRRNDLSDEQFIKVAGYAQELINKMIKKEFTPPTREEIIRELTN